MVYLDPRACRNGSQRSVDSETERDGVEEVVERYICKLSQFREKTTPTQVLCSGVVLHDIFNSAVRISILFNGMTSVYIVSVHFWQ